jgi:hypothetical protein
MWKPVTCHLSTNFTKSYGLNCGIITVLVPYFIAIIGYNTPPECEKGIGAINRSVSSIFNLFSKPLYVP